MPSSPVFVTRKFPPSIGGMETLAAGVWRSIETVRPDAVLLAYGGQNRGLLLWLPRALGRLLTLIVRGRVESVLAGDALMNAMVAPLTTLRRLPRATMVMGLDVTFDNWVYRILVLPVLRRTRMVVAISAATARATQAVGVGPGQVRVVRLGVPLPASARRTDSARLLRQKLDLDESAFLLATLGRLVRRKGVRWFVDEVLPGLPPDVHYAIAGTGPEVDAIRDAAQRHSVQDRVHLLGRVDDELREHVLRGSDIFVQPNVPVEGDMEGFGLVTIEAALRGTPVVAADLEGIKDAVVDGRTGIMLPPGDVGAWTATVTRLADDRTALTTLGEQFQENAAELFGEEHMGRQLTELLGVARRPE